MLAFILQLLAKKEPNTHYLYLFKMFYLLTNYIQAPSDFSHIQGMLILIKVCVCLEGAKKTHKFEVCFCADNFEQKEMLKGVKYVFGQDL